MINKVRVHTLKRGINTIINKLYFYFQWDYEESKNLV